MGRHMSFFRAQIGQERSATDVTAVVGNHFDGEGFEELVEKYAFIDGATRGLDQGMYSGDTIAGSVDQ